MQEKFNVDTNLTVLKTQSDGNCASGDIRYKENLAQNLISEYFIVNQEQICKSSWKKSIFATKSV